VVICLQQGANDLHTVQLMPLPPHHSVLYMLDALPDAQPTV